MQAHGADPGVFIRSLATRGRLGGLSSATAGSAAVLDAAGIHRSWVGVERPAGLTEREVDVLGLLARGLTNRQIAEALDISVKTVGAHVEHVYAKAGVRSRAAATLFAMQHDLLG